MAIVPKLRNIISFRQDMTEETELRSVPSWKAHQLTGQRRGTWSQFVTKNWRLKFRVDRASLSPDRAIRIEKAFGVAMDTLMRMQNSFPIAQASGCAADIDVARYTPPTSQQPPA